MYPVLLKIGPITIHSFGVFLGLAFFVSYILIKKQFDDQAEFAQVPQQLLAAVLIGGFLGAKIHYLIEAMILGLSPVAFLVLSGAGFAWYGGFIGSCVALFFILNPLNGKRLFVLDRVLPVILLGYAIGRIGCFLAGDGDYGPPTDLPWAMAFPNGIEPTLVRVHPTPIYDSLLAIALFVPIWQLRKRKLSEGTIAGISAIALGVERFTTEFFRNTPIVWLGWIKFAHIISLVLMAIGAAVLVMSLKMRKT